MRRRAMLRELPAAANRRRAMCQARQQPAAPLSLTPLCMHPWAWRRYETMLVLRPDMSEEERDQELAKFEAFLKKEASKDIKVTVRGRQRLAYPIKRCAAGAAAAEAAAAVRGAGKRGVQECGVLSPRLDGRPPAGFTRASTCCTPTPPPPPPPSSCRRPSPPPRPALSSTS